MKIKLWQWGYEFDRQDAEIVVPLALLVLGLAFTHLNKEILWSGAAGYYLLYFFLKSFLVELRKHIWMPLHQWLFYRCAYCKSRDVFLQGYQGYHSDEHYAYHLCNRCWGASIEVRNNKLMKSSVGKLT